MSFNFVISNDGVVIIIDDFSDLDIASGHITTEAAVVGERCLTAWIGPSTTRN